ncbi:6068_t:CDS:10 [Scutellospora calospora]|uniref:6068_t:CDS:1 n=1 Tax=Scutellospora calospora TaxID=85575 RepID=A0ACA9KZH5_9GLOM|nr:6068_t:CDS:10 [Scutellospora calospora]
MYEPAILKEYLNKLLPLVLGAKEVDLNFSLWSLWSVQENTEKLSQFANDPLVNVLYITKLLNDRKEDYPFWVSYSYDISQEITYNSNIVTSIVIIKHFSKLDPAYPIESQIQFLNLPGPATNELGFANVSPYKAFHSFIQHAITPYFDAYVNTKGVYFEDISLPHLQKYGEIPEISLNIHPVIRKAVEKSKQKNKRINIDFIDQSLLSDTQFLNRIQSDVNSWIKKIQKLTELQRDPLSDTRDTAIKEINFWLSMEPILEEIDEQLKSDPIEALALAEAISRDFNDVLLKVLDSHRLMYMDYNEFEKVIAGAEDVFITWDVLIREFTTVSRDVTRKRSDKFIPIKINPAHNILQERVAFVRNFRKRHEQLQTIVTIMSQPKDALKTVIKSENNIVQQEEGVIINAIKSMEEIKSAYESFKDIDVLDVSIEGGKILIQAENTYNERASRVENQIIANLRDRLGIRKNANEMFRVISMFSALIVRPKIHGVIQEYQKELFDTVKKDINKLKEKFIQQYRKSEASHMSQLRDIPSISGFIIWARQIERQLQIYIKRVEDAFGKDWETFEEGQKLIIECNDFKKKLDTRPIFEAWQTEICNRRDINFTGKLFKITRNRAQGNILKLEVNFDPQIITLFKEVRNLLWLDCQVLHNINTLAKVTKHVYPFAVSLIETVRIYSQTVQKVQKHPEIIMLVAAYRNEVQAMIAEGFTYEWWRFDNPENKHVTFIREFANIVSIFQDKVDALITNYEEISRLIENLKSCAYQMKKFNTNLEKIQRLVSELAYSNLDAWVAKLDKRIETILLQRLQYAISLWTTEFMSSGEVSRTFRNDSIDGDRSTITKAEKPVLEPSVHEVRIRNQVIYLDPPIEDARARWYNQLHKWLSVVCNLQRIQVSFYEICLQDRWPTSRETTYSNLLTKILDGSLEKAYEVIETKLKEVSDYVNNKWYQFQPLWDLEPNNIYDRLGDNLKIWKQILSEIKKPRTIFDNSDFEGSFGLIVVDYEQAQSKVNAKYNQWQRDIFYKFGRKLGDSMREFHSSISHSCKELENKSMENNSPSEAVALINFIEDLKSKVSKWSQDIEIFQEDQKTLERQQYYFPSDWLSIEQLEAEWSAFNEILNIRNNQIKEQIDDLRSKITIEDKFVEDKINEMVSEWDENKPIQGELKYNIATYVLSNFEARITRIKEEYDMVCRAKEVLDMDYYAESLLDDIIGELKDLKYLWSSLSQIWQSINELNYY